MPLDVLLTGDGHGSLRTHLQNAISRCNPRAIGVASAFVSPNGVAALDDMLQGNNRRHVRLIAGTSLAFTHPNALILARSHRWDVRLGRNALGIYHPKIIVCGDSFDDDGVIANPSLAYIGSAKLTGQALDQNTECGLLITAEVMPADMASSFRRLWHRATELSVERLELYKKLFTRHNRTRTARELQEVGAADVVDPVGVGSGNIRQQTRPAFAAIDLEDADTVWIGLESATGDWTFQPEFPRDVGDVVLRFIQERNIPLRRRGTGDRRRIVAVVSVACSDGRNVEMTFTYYFHNSMRRLNVPNDVPNANWAREHRRGIAVVSRTDDPNAVIALDILQPGPEADEIARRSFTLGTWNRTTSRAFGWF